ncbi:MAG TPA: F0F1 ATP synthase subunit epsilon [Steroidobacteraceae bacterium]|nr:F0F1 ATP synthase subunit epsilon [Steroidobacteraceae bacterium]
MTLKVLLPYGVYATYTAVTRLVIPTSDGAYGFLPHRRDCVAALAPGILTYQCAEQPENYMALDAGVLAKTGPEVLISVRNAISGADLAQLRAAVNDEFRKLNADEVSLRTQLARIEAGFMSRMVALHRG